MDHNEIEAWSSIDNNYNQKEYDKAEKKVRKEFFKTEKQPILNIKKEIIYWEGKDGQKIDIDTMTLEYMRNILKIIIRKNLLKDK